MATDEFPHTVDNRRLSCVEVVAVVVVVVALEAAAQNREPPTGGVRGVMAGADRIMHGSRNEHQRDGATLPIGDHSEGSMGTVILIDSDEAPALDDWHERCH